MTPAQTLRHIFEQALQVVRPEPMLTSCLTLKKDVLIVGEQSLKFDLSRFKRVVVLGAGKASSEMARVLERILGPWISAGLVVTKYGHGVSCKKVKTLEAGHPVPDQNSLRAGIEFKNLITSYQDKDTLFIFLLSGGASSLLVLPEQGLSLDDKMALNKLLLSCGANIYEINVLRKHVSQIKGGKLSKMAYPSSLLTLIISDVIGDPLDVIGSGPTVPDSSSWAECKAILDKYELWDQLTPSLRTYFEQGVKGKLADTPKSGDKFFSHVKNLIVGNNFTLLTKAAQIATDLGYNTLILSSELQGEAKEAGKFLASIAKTAVKHGCPCALPCCIVSGGETTVRLGQNPGLGGRNQELALSFALDVEGLDNVFLLSAGSDGTDGPTDAAGAIVDGRTIKQARSKGLNGQNFLTRHDSYSFLQAIDALLFTGPTYTNVMDIQIILGEK